MQLRARVCMRERPRRAGERGLRMTCTCWAHWRTGPWREAPAHRAVQGPAVAGTSPGHWVVVALPHGAAPLAVLQLPPDHRDVPQYRRLLLQAGQRDTRDASQAMAAPAGMQKLQAGKLQESRRAFRWRAAGREAGRHAGRRAHGGRAAAVHLGTEFDEGRVLSLAAVPDLHQQAGATSGEAGGSHRHGLPGGQSPWPRAISGCVVALLGRRCPCRIVACGLQAGLASLNAAQRSVPQRAPGRRAACAAREKVRNGDRRALA